MHDRDISASLLESCSDHLIDNAVLLDFFVLHSFEHLVYFMLVLLVLLLEIFGLLDEVDIFICVVSNCQGIDRFDDDIEASLCGSP